MFFSRNSSSVAAVIKSGSLKKLQKLVDAANCNALDEQQRAPLYYAILYKQAEIAAWLLSLGCDVDSGAENSEQYVMEFVVSQLSEPLLTAFIDHGETLPSYIDGMPLLHALMGHEKITERYFALVLSHGADINTIDLRATNQTVLAYYVGQEQVRVDTLKVAWLIKLGADVNKAETPKKHPIDAHHHQPGAIGFANETECHHCAACTGAVGEKWRFNAGFSGVPAHIRRTYFAVSSLCQLC